MKQIIPVIIISIFAFSCQDEVNTRPESVYKKQIAGYLTSLKANSKEVQLTKLEVFEESLDFTNVKIYGLKTTEQAIIVDLIDFNDLGGSNEIKALFFLNSNEIVRGYIVAFNDKKRPGNYEDLILSVIERGNDFNKYSGRVSIFSLTQNILLFNELDNGQLTINGIAKTKDSSKDGGRTQACIDWYLITTYYYPNGTTRVSEQYLFTSCGCGEEPYRMATDCGGGSGGGGATAGSTGPSFPANPQPNDEYEYTDNDGTFTLYRYMLSEDGQYYLWTRVFTSLAPVTVQSEPENYSFLSIEWPVHDQVVVGPDEFIYTYDAFSGHWEGFRCIINQLKSSCFNEVANNSLDPSRVNTFNRLIQDIFGLTDKVNLILRDDIPVGPNKAGITLPPEETGDIINITVVLNPNELSKSSKEFIASVLFHEVFHAIVVYLDNDNFFRTSGADQHLAMFTSYLDVIATSIQSAYPSLSLHEAQALLLSGMLEYKTEYGDLYGKILTAKGFTETELIEIGGYHAFGLSGTDCN